MATKLADWPDQVKAKWPLDSKPVGLFSDRMGKPFGQMILDAMQERGWSVAELSRRSGVSYDTINKFKHRPQASTKADSARRLCDALEIDWPDQEGVVLGPDAVPIYDVEVSAGPGVYAPETEMIVGQLSFPPGYLARVTDNAPLHNLSIVTVKGESMSPTLRGGDVVMIDRTKTSLGYDGLFVLRFDDALHVKRIGRGPAKGKITVISDNPSYPTLTRDLSDVQAIGKVLWYGRKE